MNRDNFNEVDNKNLYHEEYSPIQSQEVVDISYIPHIPADTPPSALDTLQKLTGVNNPENIGLNGPVQAAMPSERNKHLEALNKYQEIYPRDAHTVARILWDEYPELTKATILTCLPYTGTIDNLSNTDWIDEQEVGKIPHQVRDPEHPRSIHQFEVRRRGYPYYGAIDTTQKNILAISRIALDNYPDNLSFLDEEYIDIHGRPHSVLEGMQSNVDWVLSKMSENPEGIIESIQINPLHHANQSWADSPDSFHHADGSIARHHPENHWGVGSIEVNTETYDALIASAKVLESQLPIADSEKAEVIRDKIKVIQDSAQKLKQSIIDNFWVEDDSLHGGYFARGTDRDKNGKIHPLQIRSSDMGHVLMSSLLEDGDPKVESIIKNLFSPEMLSLNGIRTLSEDSVRYNPDAYHNGSVWPWDTYTIAQGLERHGYFGLARELEDRIMNFHLNTNTLAEYGSGGNDKHINMTEQVTVFDPDVNTEPIDQYSVHSTIQPPQEIQAWTVASVLAIERKKQQESLPSRAIDPAKLALESDILHSISK